MRFLKFEIILFFDKINLTSFLQININKRYVRVRRWSDLYQNYFNLPSFQSDCLAQKQKFIIFSNRWIDHKNFFRFHRPKKNINFRPKKISKIELLGFDFLNCIALSDNFRSRLKKFWSSDVEICLLELIPADPQSKNQNCAI